MRGDRHGRAARADHDPRHRPSDGFRVRDLARFERIAEEAIGSLPEPVLAVVKDAELVLEEIPPEPDPGEAVALAAFKPASKRGPARITLYRRPLELRVMGRIELAAFIRLVVGQEIVHTLNLDVDLEDDEDP